MSPLKYSTTVICAVFIAIGAASSEEVNKFGEVGGSVSFGPTSINPSVTSIIWKHKNSDGVVVKAIEWDVEDDYTIPNQRFKDITTLDNKTGQITISKLNDKHSGLYTIDINSKEQEQKFKLEILPPLPKPEIKIEKIKVNPDVVYLRCEYSGTIIWKNSAGDTLKGSKNNPTGESITVEKKGNPENFYTCTLKNEVNERTSEPVYERDIFKESAPWWIAVIVLIPICIIILLVTLYKFWLQFHDFVYNNLKEKPCIGAVLDCLDGNKKNGDKPDVAADSNTPLRVDSDGGDKDDKL